MTLEPSELSSDELVLSGQVRQFLAEHLPSDLCPGLGISGSVDAGFSRLLAEQGWVGMTFPTAYGGSNRSAVDRFVVTEELLAVGAPVGFHWAADRQCGPAIARFGTEDQKRQYLPAIARGELSFCLGMSEPESGSDLASVRTRADRIDGGWRINGLKIWTSHAQHATHILLLARTSPDRRRGLTKFIIGLPCEGVTISPIEFIDGSLDFCEVSFSDVFVADEARLGPVGAGWSQNTEELAMERSGADRWMSMVPVLQLLAATAEAAEDPLVRRRVGSIRTRLWSVRGMSLAVARMVDQGRAPVVEAALVKDMGTLLERECVELCNEIFGRAPLPTAADPYEALLARALLVSPGWTIRGGTTEILRTIIAKGVRS